MASARELASAAGTLCARHGKSWLLAAGAAWVLGGCGGGSSPAGANSPPAAAQASTAPTITGTPATAAVAGSRYSFQPAAADVDHDALVFSIRNRPGWAAFDATTGLLAGTPASGDAGVYTGIVISVSDGSSSASLPAFEITAAPAPTGSSPGNGNYDPAFLPTAADYVYVDLNSTVNGSGRSPADPTNRLPAQVGNGAQLLFNSDDGVQSIPCRNDAVIVNGDDVQVASYGSGRATVSAYQVVDSGWTQVGMSNVWRRSFAGGSSGAGAVVGNVIDLASTRESPTGDVLDWQNLEAVGDKIGAFRSDPTVLPVGSYAYDWQQFVMYVNVGANPNGRQLGISCVGRLINTLAASSPSRVSVHGLRLIGFARDAINILGGAGYWRIHDNELYAMGGMYNVVSKWYFGSGIQMSQDTHDIEIDNNRIVQTFDSPITPQHFGGSTGGYLHDLHFHDNFIDRWALGAVEMSDFGTHNRFANILIEDNIAINGGQGFSRTGDTPQGYTDGIQVRGGDSSSFSGLVVRNNKISAFDANVYIGGNNFSDAIILDGNTLSGAQYGIQNDRPAQAAIDASYNTLCGNGVQIADKSTASRYLGDTLKSGPCAIP
jgi:hypothetical protein